MATLTVGTGEQYSTIAAAVAATSDGDTVLVNAGVYFNDFVDVTHKITLQSVGGLAIIDATYSPSNGKGALVADNDVTVDGFGFTGVTVADANGAGIRYDSGNLTIRNSVFWNNQNGLLANPDANGNILIQNSEFGFNGSGTGYTHNIYVNGVNSLTIEGSYFHDVSAGHEIKSRAYTTTIIDNRIQDNAGDASYDIDLPDGGVGDIENNVIEKGANAQNYTAIHYGGEGGPYTGSSLTIAGNTLVDDNANGRVLNNQTTVNAAFSNNQLYSFAAAQFGTGPYTETNDTTLTTEPKLDLTTMIPTSLPTAPAGTPTGGGTALPTSDASQGTVLTSYGPGGAVVASGHILQVGAGCTYNSLGSALAASQDGDTIQVKAGTYVNDFGTVNHKVIIEGVGGIARFTVQNDLLEDQGILGINTDCTLKNLEFTGTHSYGGQAAGLQVNAGNVTIDNTLVDNNEVGLKVQDNATTTVSVYNSEFGNNGDNDKGTNNVMVGAIESLTMVGDYVHGAWTGHEVVDDAFNTDIENTRIIDGAGVASSFLLDLGRGGNAIVKNDTLVKGPDSVNSILLHVGGDGQTWLNSNVTVTNTTMVSELVNLWHPYSYFIVDDASAAPVNVSATNDSFVGGVVGSNALNGATVTGSNNTSTQTIPAIDTSSPVSATAAPAFALQPQKGADALTLVLSDNPYADNAEFIAKVDGVTVGGGMVSAQNGSASQVFTFAGNFGAGSHSVEVDFVNSYTSTGYGAATLFIQSASIGNGTAAGAILSTATPYTATVTDTLSLKDFDPTYYDAHTTAALTLKAAANTTDPMVQYHTTGWTQGANPDAWFDTNYYLAMNPDVKAAGIDPLQHFETYGWKEGRAPSLLFDDAKYLAANPDVKAAGIEPLEHYIEFGQYEGRASFLTGGTEAYNPGIDTTFYDTQLGASLIPTTMAGNQQAMWSYDTTGWQKGLNPNAWFDTNYYLAHNPDVAAAHIDPLLHYETYGWKEGRDPSAAFSTDKYLNAYADVKAAGVDPLIHYLVFGQAEGRQTFSA